MISLAIFGVFATISAALVTHKHHQQQRKVCKVDQDQEFSEKVSSKKPINKMSKRVLIINPNSSESITKGIESQLSKVVPGFTYSYFTGPPSSPPEINNTEDGLSSAKACMEKINENPEEYLNYDGYLICCFSDHPLVHQLSNIVNVPVMGIFQACVLYALNSANDDNKVAILTSSKSWETILDNSLLKFFNGSNTPHDLPSFFLPTLASDVDVLKLADPENYAKLQGKIQQLIDQNARIILLGCAGLSTLDAKFMKDYPGTKFIDSIKIGIQLLAANVRFNEYLQ